jgi:TonB family protein
MTAAVARPPLFHNLVASRPDRDRNSFAASAVSLAFHAAGITAVLLVTGRVATAPIDDSTLLTPVEPLVQPPDAQTTRAHTGGQTSTSSQVAPPIPYEFVAPTVVLPSIPLPGKYAVTAAPDYVPSGTASRSGTGTTGNAAGTGEQPGDFVPLTVVPRLLNRPEVMRLLQRFYPPLLMQAGIGGTAVVWLRLDEEGVVMETRIKTPSGQDALDRAALDVASRARFSPAYNRETKVKVWVELPIVFSAK